MIYNPDQSDTDGDGGDKQGDACGMISAALDFDFIHADEIFQITAQQSPILINLMLTVMESVMLVIR